MKIDMLTTKYFKLDCEVKKTSYVVLFVLTQPPLSPEMTTLAMCAETEIYVHSFVRV